MRGCRRHALTAILAVLTCGAAISSPIQAAEPPGIYMQELTAAKASKKVATVLWTRRSDRYTLQVVFPKESATGFINPPTKHPAVRLWLLGADGLVMFAARVPPKDGEISTPVQNEQTYSVPLSAGANAVAAVLQIDDQYFVDSIQRFSDN
jgi:hypothetical protein